MPERSLIVRQRARDEVLAIADRIALDNPKAAQRFKAAFERDCGLLLEFPQVGRRCKHAGRELRGLRSRPLTGFVSWLVFYRVTTTAVDVGRVLHGARDLRRALRF